MQHGWPDTGPRQTGQRGVEQVTHNEGSDDLRTKAAWLYYMEDMTQHEIAKTLGLRRSRVLRILASSPVRHGADPRHDETQLLRVA
jgi:hypothetical protein